MKRATIICATQDGTKVKTNKYKFSKCKNRKEHTDFIINKVTRTNDKVSIHKMPAEILTLLTSWTLQSILLQQADQPMQHTIQ